MPYVKAEIDRRKKGDQVKNVFIKVRVSEKEREAMHRLASKNGLTLSDWIRSRTIHDNISSCDREGD
jgi:predicted DNA binding CopG/RHH family protein